MQFMELIGWLIVNLVHAVHVHSSCIVHVRIHVVYVIHVVDEVDVVHLPNELFMKFIFVIHINRLCSSWSSLVG